MDTMPMPNRLGKGLLPALALVLIGCGNLTSGGLGEVEIQVSPEELQEEATALLGAMSAGDDPELFLEGTLSVTVRAFVRERPGVWFEITDGPQEVVLSLDDPGAVVLARRELPTGDYSASRVVFGRIRADITAGLILDGDTITGEVRVRLGPDNLIVVEDTGPVRVVRRRTVPVLLEMRTRRWVRLLDREERAVDETDFREFFRVRVRPPR
jgi:hypothetical protein